LRSEISIETRDPEHTVCLVDSLDLALISVGTIVFLLILTLIDHVERRENDKGRPLFHPWRVPVARTKGDRVDRTLRNALSWPSLGGWRGGWTLRSTAGLSREAGRRCRLAVECLERAEHGDRVLGWRDRWRDAEEGRGWLERAR
jgi:hypothetical protein